MSELWKPRPLLELCSDIVDCPHSTPVWTAAGVVVLRSQNIRNGRLDLSEPSYTDEEHYALRTRRAVPQSGDIVITREAPMGEVCMIPEGLRCCLGQRMVLLRPNDDECHGRFLLYALQSPLVQARILESEGTGSTVSNLRIPLLERLGIPLPRTLDEQKEIASVLGSLDDKIDMNRRTCAILEAIVRATFQSWFVDFEPVKAKAAGEPPDSICRRLGLMCDVLALFPSALAGADVPVGWSMDPLERLAVLDKDLVNPFEEPDATWEHYSIPAYDEGHLPASDLGASIKSNKFRVHPHSVLVSKLNPHFPRTWLPFVRDERRAICSTEFLPLVVREPDDRAFLYGLATSTTFENAMVERVTGTTGSHQRVAPASLLAMSVVAPPEDLRRAFGRFAMDALRQAAELRSTSAALGKTRDALLGPLMSGNLPVAVGGSP